MEEDGTKHWHNEKGLHHREDGPAIERPYGTKWWYINGKKHREDGPAIEWWNGNKEYYYHDQKIECSSDEEFKRLIALKAFW